MLVEPCKGKAYAVSRGVHFTPVPSLRKLLELATNRVDKEAVKMLEEWIKQLPAK